MGHVRTTVLSLTVQSVDAEKGLILIRGAVPGPAGGLVLVRSAVKAGLGRKPVGLPAYSTVLPDWNDSAPWSSEVSTRCPRPVRSRTKRPVSIACAASDAV